MTSLTSAMLIGYALRVMICSGILFSYYRIVLANKPCYQWNRFFLLLSVPVGLLLPLLRIPVLPATDLTSSGVFTPLPLVESTTGFHDSTLISSDVTHPGADLSIVLLTAGILIMLTLLASALFRIWRLTRSHARRKTASATIIFTREKDAPFSFFRYIFWNDAIPPDSEQGKKILQHELVHVRQWHSADKIVLHILSAVSWFNPFYWITRRELGLVHEFICDREVLDGTDTRGLSEMLLSMLFPGRQLSLVNNFYSSSIKRRLAMLSQTTSAKRSGLFKLLALPLIAGLLAAFTLTKKAATDPQHLFHPIKTMTVVIDAGHGGKDAGAMAPDGTPEKDITLAIARKMSEMNTDPDLKIILTRKGDEYPELRSRVDLAIKERPDAFISLHVDNEEESLPSGFSFYVSRKHTDYSGPSQSLGTSVAREVGKIYSASSTLRQRTGKGIWVLDAPGISYPAILLTCGSLKNAKDLAFISDPVHQGEIAAQILKALKDFGDGQNR